MERDGRIMNIKDIEPWNNSKIVEFYVSCFDRKMIIVFKDFIEYLERAIQSYLIESYYDWQEDDKGYCCEEYMLETLPEYYKNNIVCVIYEEDKQNEYKSK